MSMILESARTLDNLADMLFSINSMRHDGVLTDAQAATMIEPILKNLENDYLPKLKHKVELLKKSKL